MIHIKVAFKKHWKLISIGILVFTLVITLLLLFLTSRKETKYIAYVGRYDHSGLYLDYIQETIIDQYIKDLNKSLSNYKLELVIFSNSTNPEVCKQVYQAIAEDKDILFTVDNSWASEIKLAKDVIKSYNLPVFFLNADKNNYDFGRSAIFIGNADNFPQELSVFLREILKSTSVIFLSETNYALHDVFLKSFEANGVNIVDTIPVLTKEISSGDKDRVFAHLQYIYSSDSNRKHLPLVINTHFDWSQEIIGFVEGQFKEITILGADYITPNIDSLLNVGKNQLFIGNQPTDALSKKITHDLKRFRAQDPKKYFSRNDASYFLNKCVTVFDLNKNWLTELDKTKILDRRKASLFNESLRGETYLGDENIYPFDSIGTLKRDTYFTHVKNGRFSSIPLQINQDYEKIPNINFGLDIIDIYNVNINENTFSSDFFYWIRMDTLFKEYEADIIFYNMKQSQSDRDLLRTNIDGQFLYKLYKVSGMFHNEYELRDYPLDLQELTIQVDILKPSDELRISFDQRSYESDPSIFERFKVPAWNKLQYSVTVDNRISKTTRGAYDNAGDMPRVYKTFNFRLEIERKFMKPFLEIILPLILITLVSVSVMFVKDLSFATIGQVSVGAFLGIITFSIALAVNSPASDYLTKTDLFFWLSFFVIFLSFVNVIYINHIYNKKQLKLIRLSRLKYTILIAYPILTILIFWY